MLNLFSTLNTISATKYLSHFIFVPSLKDYLQIKICFHLLSQYDKSCKTFKLNSLCTVLGGRTKAVPHSIRSFSLTFFGQRETGFLRQANTKN